MTDGEVLLNWLKQPRRKIIQYQAMVLATPDNLMKPFVLNERFHLPHEDTEQFLKNEIICLI
ncbi:hypothetical protein BTN50_0602 [Candidatus Enterovibrio altilux]|uniref:Uncharacterized protein n=1 Tax=Candidatus Enterovibrio altilux TaxID=1927128 RepID=A0A291B7Z5_9GAMM|nr:hypothetical protein BTN50_0602 [Candidatus Enterovibrio luxaltus]